LCHIIIIISMYIPCIFIYYYLFVPKMHIYVLKYQILSQIAPTCFGASAPSSGRFYIAFAKVMKYKIWKFTSDKHNTHQSRTLNCIWSHYHILPTAQILSHNDLMFNNISIILIFYNFSKRSIKTSWRWCSSTKTCRSLCNKIWYFNICTSMCSY
jgi:hypothetical protein